ncbi:MAG: hypothetical protein ABIK30_08365 [bacterium]
MGLSYRINPVVNVFGFLFTITSYQNNVHSCLTCPTAGGRQAGILMSGTVSQTQIPEFIRVILRLLRSPKCPVGKAGTAGGRQAGTFLSGVS